MHSNVQAWVSVNGRNGSTRRSATDGRGQYRLWVNHRNYLLLNNNFVTNSDAGMAESSPIRRRILIAASSLR